MSIMVATGKGATMGVLFRNAEAIEVLRKVDTLVVDKTGTLTEGKPKLVTSCRRPASTKRRCCGCAAASNAAASIRWRGAIVRGREDAASTLVDAREFRASPARASRHGRRPTRWRSAIAR